MLPICLCKHDSCLQQVRRIPSHNDRSTRSPHVLRWFLDYGSESELSDSAPAGWRIVEREPAVKQGRHLAKSFDEISDTIRPYDGSRNYITDLSREGRPR